MKNTILFLYVLGASVAQLAAAQLAAAQFAAAEPAKNVLFLVSDDLRAGVLGCYGDQVSDTPNIDRLASRGVLFERSYCQGTVCGPSRASFMRGRYFGNEGITLGEHFIAQGRTTARVGKIFHMRVPGDIIAGTHGQDVPACWTQRFNASGREAHTPGEYACLNQNVFTTALEGRQSTGDPHRPFVTVSYEGDGSDQPDAKAAAKSVELLREFKSSEKPFMLAVGFVRPHYPMVAPRQYFDRYPHDQMTLPHVPEGDLDDIPPAGISGSNSRKNGLAAYPDNQRRMWSGYRASVTFMDSQVGRVIDELDRLGLTESTVIVFTSDHGYHLGDHTFWQKSNLHEQVTRVPLIVAAPGVMPSRSRSITQLVDVFPTLCELTGAPVPESVQGKSLVPILRDPAAEVHDAAFSYAQGGHHALRTDRWAYMRYADATEELYDMDADPGQFNNLAQKAAYSETIAKLRLKLDERAGSTDAARIRGKRMKKAK
ncbi:sulfatase [Stieleria varia]|uniref:Choline-sulfatase n=1 Tax=Stieleria varia TaxID=2528005 RepID=A0A5C6AXQ2_9BACT|nr:sulfatase [Stieleria varia]TWU04795.1 Choline-sulfatase [Stieleria varia]